MYSKKQIKETKIIIIKLFQVYDYAINTDALKEEERFLDNNRMRNIIIVAIKSNKVEYAYNFLNKHIGSVDPKFKK